MSHVYQFHPHLVLRTPSRPFDGDIGEHTIAGLLHDPQFLEAVYLASPLLWAECQKWQRGELTDTRRLDKLRRSLTRYYVRATTRCTPFGLFAGCALVAWGTVSQMVLAPTCSARHTRLDMHYLCALAQHLAGHGTRPYVPACGTGPIPAFMPPAKNFATLNTSTSAPSG